MIIFVINPSQMKKLFYLFTCLTVLFASSCSKQCVQCQATDRYGVVVNTSDVVCDHSLNRKNFENTYKTNFTGYNAVCINVNQ